MTSLTNRTHHHPRLLPPRGIDLEPAWQLPASLPKDVHEEYARNRERALRLKYQGLEDVPLWQLS